MKITFHTWPFTDCGDQTEELDNIRIEYPDKGNYATAWTSETTAFTIPLDEATRIQQLKNLNTICPPDDEVILKVQDFLEKRGWGIALGNSDSFKDLKKAIHLATSQNDIEGFDEAIKFLLKRDWAFGSPKAFVDFGKGLKLYKKLDLKRLQNLVKEARKNLIKK